MKYDKYSKYKDSGVEWLGMIPESWEVRKIKFLFDEINERSDFGNEDLLSVSQYTGVTKKRDKLEDGDLLTNAETLEGYKKVYEGDLVSNIMLAWNGSLGFSPFYGITSPAYSIYRLNKGNYKQYFHYLLRTELYKSEFKRNSSGVIESRLRLYTDDFFQINSILPPLAEQTAIANYLDNKTTKIEKAIAEKQKLIELLKERKQILIQNAVTKGLNPNAKMKDSGVEWIGEIPHGWIKTPLRHILKKIEQGNSPSPTNGYSSTYVIKLSAIKKGEFYKKKLKPVQEKDFDIRYQLKKGDFLMTRGNTPELVADTCIIREYIENKIMYSDLVFKLIFYINKIDINFMLNCMQSSYLRRQIIMSARGSNTTMIKVSQDQFKSWVFFIPNLKEQIQISTYIETQSQKIDKAISLQQNQIEKLKEYKVVLIDSVVRGKVKVS